MTFTNIIAVPSESKMDATFAVLGQPHAGAVRLRVRGATRAVRVVGRILVTHALHARRQAGARHHVIHTARV